MKKTWFVVALALSMLLALTACSDKKGSGIPTATPGVGASMPLFRDCGGEVKLGQYKGLQYEHESIEVTDEELKGGIEEILKQYPNYQKDESRDGTEVKKGDFVNIDYTGYMDGKAFENGADTNFVLEIGSNSFIDGFEDGLIGKTIGEEVDINVTFPDPYQNNPDLAGKPAVFTVKINHACKVLNEMTDEYVSEYTGEKYKTVEEFTEALREEIEKEKENSRESTMWNALMKMVLEDTEFVKIDQEDIDFYFDLSVESAKQTAAMYGMTMEQFVQIFGGYKNVDEYYEEEKGYAETNVKQYMILEAIADAEGIEVTDELYAEYVKEYMDQVGEKDQAKFEANYGKDYLYFLIRNDLALEFIHENAIVAYPEGEEPKEEAEGEN